MEPDFFATHHWVTGASGSGKPSWLSRIPVVLLQPGRRHPIVILDFKGELTALLLNIIIPALVNEPGGQRLLQDLRIVRPFGEHLPMLNLTLPEPGVPR